MPRDPVERHQTDHPNHHTHTHRDTVCKLVCARVPVLCLGRAEKRMIVFRKRSPTTQAGDNTTAKAVEDASTIFLTFTTYISARQGKLHVSKTPRPVKTTKT